MTSLQYLWKTGSCYCYFSRLQETFEAAGVNLNKKWYPTSNVSNGKRSPNQLLAYQTIVYLAKLTHSICVRIGTIGSIEAEVGPQ